MSISLDIQYIMTISTHLPRFRWNRYGQVAVARCPICGDSKKDLTKTRFYLFTNKAKTGFSFSCKNCGESGSFHSFMKEYHPQIYQQYKLEALKEGGYKVRRSDSKLAPLPVHQEADKPPVIEAQELPASSMLSVADLEDHHTAKIYCRGRKIPEHALSKVFYTANFNKWTEKHLGDTDGAVPSDARIIFPLYKPDGELYGAQGRVIAESSKATRFITAKKEGETFPKLFGLERVNTSLPVIVVEGVIDSLFLPNCIALVGGDVTPELSKMLSSKVFCALDNEPRSRDTVSRMKRAIDLGFHVCFWQLPTTYKDINDMVKLGGMDIKSIVEHIGKHSYAGLQAKIALSKWAKV